MSEVASKNQSDRAEILRQKIADKSVRIGVVGLGYVGLPLSLTFVECGFSMLGFDTDPEKPARLLAGDSYLKHIPMERVRAAAATGRLEATSDLARLAEPDVILICVPTPLTPQREPDMSFVRSTAEAMAACLRPGQLVVLESSTYPGTTDELVSEILLSSGLSCGSDFFLAYSPEREDPGNPDFGTRDIPKIVGGVDPVSGDLAEALYSAVVRRVVRVSTARAAEAAKLLENIFRAVNIALVNELKMVYDRMGIDVWEVIDAAATKPFGFMRFDPGPGWGGHCIPVDPFYLSWKAREFGTVPRFIELAGEINVRMPEYVIDKLQTALNERGKALKNSKILLLGLAYKKNLDDIRGSPALELMYLLDEAGALVAYHDPYVSKVPLSRRHRSLAERSSLPLTPEELGSHDAVILVTDHNGVNYEQVVSCASLIVDTRGVLRGSHVNVVKA